MGAVKACVVCGRAFDPYRDRDLTCAAPECRAARKRARDREYRESPAVRAKRAALRRTPEYLARDREYHRAAYRRRKLGRG